MSFRRKKDNRLAEQRKWREWLAANEAALLEAGLSNEVLISQDHWTDFLQNGYLEWHPESSSGFTFDQLTSEQMKKLLKVLQQSHDYPGEGMAGWIRTRTHNK